VFGLLTVINVSIAITVNATTANLIAATGTLIDTCHLHPTERHNLPTTASITTATTTTVSY